MKPKFRRELRKSDIHANVASDCEMSTISSDIFARTIDLARPRSIIVASGGTKKGGEGEELENGSRIRERYAIYDAVVT